MTALSPLTPSLCKEEDAKEKNVLVSSAPVVSMIWSQLLCGQSQYLGGEVGGPQNLIYFIPGHARYVLVLDPADDSVHHIGAHPLHGQYKWLRAVKAPTSGIIYGLPCHSDFVLRIDPYASDPDLQVSLLPLPPNDENGIIGMPWKYHGGALCPIDGCIYAIPQYATRVLKVDPTTEAISYVGPHLEGRYKWYGGVVGCDHAVYGIPQNSPSVLRIDPSQQSVNKVVTLHGSLGSGGFKWHGGSATPDGSTIFGIPCNANAVLRIDPARPEPIISIIGNNDGVVKSGRHRTDDKYKFAGAVVDSHGKVYCLPSGAERVLQINANGNVVREVGPNLKDTRLEIRMQNKWQNGFTSEIDGCLYGVPLNGETVLRIDPSSTGDVDDHDGMDVKVETIGEPVAGLNKWEGCVVSADGVAYCIPNNYKGILKIVPAGFKCHFSATATAASAKIKRGEK